MGTGFNEWQSPPDRGVHRRAPSTVFPHDTLEWQATFEAGEARIGAVTSMVLVAPAGMPHRLENAGPGRLLQIDTHSSDRFITDWLDS